ncbi:MAG: succinate dehydrogenase, hydrophobic membrane anchor protein [Candidatus Methylopumilus sp.]|jgi:succinate dehydrogenase / fumarate reductase membrane anchor subunit
MVMQIFSKAFHGLRDWLVQRATGAIMALYTVLMTGMLLVQRPDSYEAWKAMMGAGWLKVSTLLFLLSLFVHAWLGVNDVLVDYVKPLRIRQGLHYAAGVSLFFYAAWTVQILWNA